MSLQTCYLPCPESISYIPYCQLKSFRIYTIAPKVEPETFKIPPMPLIHNKVSNNFSLRRKLAIRRDKYFSTISASGPDTVQILKDLRKMRKVHILRKFEFDPYLCEESGIKPLSKVVPSLRRVKEIRFSVRRIDCNNMASEKFAPLHKIVGLKKLKLELSKTLYVDNDNYLRIMKELSRKCSLIKTWDLTLNSLQHVSENVLRRSMSFLSNFRSLENLTLDVIKKQDAYNRIPPNEHPDLRFQRKVKNFQMTFGVALNGWDAATSNNCPILLLTCLANSINPEKLGFKFFRALFIEPVVDALKLTLSRHDRLRDFSMDIISSELEDEVVIYTLRVMTEVKHIEKISFKITQRPSDSNLSGDAIIQMIDLISKAVHLKKFDIYLRNLLLETSEKKDVDKRLGLLGGNIKYKHLERSLHLYKN